MLVLHVIPQHSYDEVCFFPFSFQKKLCPFHTHFGKNFAFFTPILRKSCFFRTHFYKKGLLFSHLYKLNMGEIEKAPQQQKQQEQRFSVLSPETKSSQEKGRRSSQVFCPLFLHPPPSFPAVKRRPNRSIFTASEWEQERERGIRGKKTLFML